MLGRPAHTVVRCDRPAPSSTPVAVSSLADATSIGAGDSFACALRTGGSVVCWGDDTYAELGDGSVGAGGSSVPVAVAGVAGVRSLAVGASHVCVLRTGPTITCWGPNYYGELGSMTGEHSTPVDVPALP
jgi:alpha-tubulin suppressor-like RCC1 family protein